MSKNRPVEEGFAYGPQKLINQFYCLDIHGLISLAKRGFSGEFIVYQKRFD